MVGSLAGYQSSKPGAGLERRSWVTWISFSATGVAEFYTIPCKEDNLSGREGHRARSYWTLKDCMYWTWSLPCDWTEVPVSWSNFQLMIHVAQWYNLHATGRMNSFWQTTEVAAVHASFFLWLQVKALRASVVMITAELTTPEPNWWWLLNITVQL